MKVHLTSFAPLHNEGVESNDALSWSATGAFPYGEIERFQIPRFGPTKAPSRLYPNLPPWLDSLILRALSVAAERRHRHYSEIAFDLATPSKGDAFFRAEVARLKRDPLRLDKTGFFILLAFAIGLLRRA